MLHLHLIWHLILTFHWNSICHVFTLKISYLACQHNVFKRRPIRCRIAFGRMYGLANLNVDSVHVTSLNIKIILEFKGDAYRFCCSKLPNFNRTIIFSLRKKILTCKNQSPLDDKMQNASDRSFIHIIIQIFPVTIKVWRNLADSWAQTLINYPTLDLIQSSAHWASRSRHLLTWSLRLFVDLITQTLY